MNNKEAKVEAIHAGLECGIIGEKYPGMEMLSFGPNLFDVHTPNEKVQISSVQNNLEIFIRASEEYSREHEIIIRSNEANCIK